jgi:GT2 family glycosyltransferase
MRELLQLIDGEIKHQNFYEVKRCLNLGDTANPDEMDWKIYQFILALQNNQLELAIIFLQEALKKTGVIDNLYVELSQLYLKNKQLESALSLCHQGLLKFPLSIELLLQYLQCAKQLNIIHAEIVQQRAGLLLSLIEFNDFETLAFCYDILSTAHREIGAIWLKEDKVYGWAMNPKRPKTVITLLAYSSNHQTRLIANQATFELKEKGIGNGFNGFCLLLEDHKNQLDIITEKGQRLLGSPLLTTPSLSSWFSNPYLLNGRLKNQKSLDRKVNIIIPVFNDLKCLKQCIDALRNIDYFQRRYHVVLINDCSSSVKIQPYLHALKKTSQFTVIHNTYNIGFIASVNIGMQQHPWRDVILLNSDTVVVNNSLERLQQLAYSDKKVATVTPLSNYAEKFSYPHVFKSNDLPPIATIKKIDRVAAKVNKGHAIETPTGNGFCFFIKRACLNEIGYFNQTDLLRGYSEESEFCLRATEKGWTHLCATHVYVGHEGGQSFKHERARLVALNNSHIEKKYPLYSERIRRFMVDDPLKISRKRIERTLLEQKKCDKLLVVDYSLDSHPLFKERLKSTVFSGQSVWILRPHYQINQTQLQLYEVSEGRSNLEYDCLTEMNCLIEDIKNINPLTLEVHHSRYFSTVLDRVLSHLKSSITVYPYDKALREQKPEWSKKIENLMALNHSAADVYQGYSKIDNIIFPDYFYTVLAKVNYSPYIAILGNINKEQGGLITDIVNNWLVDEIPLTFLVIGDSNERYALESTQKVIFTSLSLNECDELKQLCSHAFILPNMVDFISEPLAQALQFKFQLIVFSHQNTQTIIALQPYAIVIPSLKNSFTAMHQTFQSYAKKVS